MENVNWYFLPYKKFSAKQNMAIDHYFASHFLEYNKPILRFYAWKPHCVSLGYHQKDDHILKDKIIKDGFDVIRRPTGGRAIYHSNELTYAIIYPKNHLSKVELYHRINDSFLTVLSNLGLDSSMEKSNSDFKIWHKKKDNFSCFSSSAQYEVQTNRKKLIGSAQRIYPNSILQHGSIMLGTEHLNLIDYLNVKPYHRRELRKVLSKSTSFLNLEEISISLDDLIGLFNKSFANKFNIQSLQEIQVNVNKLEYGI